MHNRSCRPVYDESKSSVWEPCQFMSIFLPFPIALWLTAARHFANLLSVQAPRRSFEVLNQSCRNKCGVTGMRELMGTRKPCVEIREAAASEEKGGLSTAARVAHEEYFGIPKAKVVDAPWNGRRPWRAPKRGTTAMSDGE